MGHAWENLRVIKGTLLYSAVVNSERESMVEGRSGDLAGDVVVGPVKAE